MILMGDNYDTHRHVVSMQSFANDADSSLLKANKTPPRLDIPVFVGSPCAYDEVVDGKVIRRFPDCSPCETFWAYLRDVILCRDIGTDGTPESEGEKNWKSEKRQMVMDGGPNSNAKQS